MGTNELYYVYGMSTMFYAMMSYYFVRKGDRLSRLVALLMCTIGMQCLLINFYAPQMSFTNDYWWFVQSSFDMIAMPMYAFILIELVKPGKLRKRAGGAVCGHRDVSVLLRSGGVNRDFGQLLPDLDISTNPALQQHHQGALLL